MLSALSRWPCIDWVFAVMILALFAGCATPIEVKTASKAQLDLLTALDGAVSDLQQSFDQFHKAKEARIREEGRMFVARQAIAAIYPTNRPMKQITADALFESYNTNVQPWVDNALALPDVEAQIVSLTKKVAATGDPALKGRYTLALQDLQELRARLIRNKPSAVTEFEDMIPADLYNERHTLQDVQPFPDILGR